LLGDKTIKGTFTCCDILSAFVLFGKGKRKKETVRQASVAAT
jgi:hypothetical protein